MAANLIFGVMAALTVYVTIAWRIQVIKKHNKMLNTYDFESDDKSIDYFTTGFTHISLTTGASIIVYNGEIIRLSSK